MKLLDTKIKGLKVFEPRIFTDPRGSFIKTFSQDFFKQHALDISIRESYFSLSQKDVIRGMHFQTPPFDHIKIVYVVQGSIVDVVLDLRKHSSTYGEYVDMELSEKNRKVLIIPKGLAHGFKSMEDHTNVVYLQTTCYAPDNDSGVRYDSFGYDWKVDSPLTSERDLSFETFSEFSTPFLFGDDT